MANPPQFTPYEANPNYDAMNIMSLGAKSGTNGTSGLAHSAIQEGMTRIARSSSGYGAIYFPPGYWRIGKDTTVTANVCLILEHGAILYVDSGKTLTIEGEINAGLTQIFSGSGTVVLNAKNPVVYPHWFGAKANGTTDDTSAINKASAATNAAATSSYAKGATLNFPPGQYKVTGALTPPTYNVKWQGAGGAVWNTLKPGASVIVSTYTGGALLDLGSSNNSNITIENLAFYGAGGTNPLDHCIYSASVNMLWMKGCEIANFGGCAIKILAGVGVFLTNIETTNVLLGYASLAAQTGGVHLAGSESNLYECDLNGPFYGLHSSYGSGYAAALYIGGAPCSMYKVVAAFAQIGIYFSSAVNTSPSFVVATRAEFNQGYGFYVNGSNRITFDDCSAYDNSQATDNTYDGFYIKAVLLTLDNCIVEGTGGATYQQRYAFNDASTVSSNSLLNSNRYTNCRAGYQVRGRTFYFAGASIFPTVGSMQYVQGLTGTGNQTFDGEKGDTFMLTVNANTSTTVKTTNLIAGHDYKLIVYNASGATPAISLDSNFKVYGYSAPANGKYRIITLSCYDGSNLMGNASGDI